MDRVDGSVSTVDHSNFWIEPFSKVLFARGVVNCTATGYNKLQTEITLSEARKTSDGNCQ
jgi:hypothetical protein